MIAGNEARRIRQALESVAGWTSEIILVINEDVDDGTDRIAGEYGAKVFREAWKGHVAQKNSAVAKATQPWILALDADEAVSVPLRDEIVRTLSVPGVSEKYAAFSCPRCTWFCGRWITHGDWYPDRQIRLWQRGLGIWGGIDPHDRLEVNGKVGKFKERLLHYTAIDMRHQLSKYVGYAEIFARQQLRAGRSPGRVNLLVRPWWRFFRSYVLRLGFLDGWQGIAVAHLVAFGTFLKYARVAEELASIRHQDMAPG